MHDSRCTCELPGPRLLVTKLNHILNFFFPFKFMWNYKNRDSVSSVKQTILKVTIHVGLIYFLKTISKPKQQPSVSVIFWSV